MNNLPYIPLDEEFTLNLGILTILLSSLGMNRAGNYIIDLDKAQIFMYLLKNPSKIDKVMMLAGKKTPEIDENETHTIKSLSSNVDILFKNRKIKHLLKYMSAKGLLAVVKNDIKSYLKLTDSGIKFYEALGGSFYDSVRRNSDALGSIKSIPSSKLYKILNELFKDHQ